MLNEDRFVDWKYPADDIPYKPPKPKKAKTKKKVGGAQTQKVKTESKPKIEKNYPCKYCPEEFPLLKSTDY